MPELPEVETVVRSVRAHLVGRRIVASKFTSRWVTPGSRAKLAARLAGRLIESVGRRGKFILIGLDKGTLTVHLGMTGKLLVAGTVDTHTHGVFTLDDGVLLYHDPRQFGSIEWSTVVPTRIELLGPEPFDITPAAFHRGRVLSGDVRRAAAPLDRRRPSPLPQRDDAVAGFAGRFAGRGGGG